MKRILHVVSVMDIGGMESFIMNMYRQIDRTEYQFDFLVHHKRRGVFEPEIEQLGGHVYHTSLMDDFNIPKYRADIDKLFSEHPEYQVVHGHLGSPALFYLGAAFRHGVPGRILHCHNSGFSRTVKGYIKHFMFQFSPRYANVHLACSHEAGVYQFGTQPFEVIPNGINVDRFQFVKSQRDATRKMWHLEDRFVVGNVGRFNDQKNHPYLVRIFHEFRKIVPEAVLLLLGTGECEDEIKQLVLEYGDSDSVIFAGLQKDAAPFYLAMDAFIMPSKFEGLPLVGLEAQCSGLPCIFSDRVSTEVKCTNQVTFLPIDEGDISCWVNELHLIRNHPVNRDIPHHGVDSYDIRSVTNEMLRRYDAYFER